MHHLYQNSSAFFFSSSISCSHSYILTETCGLKTKSWLKTRETRSSARATAVRSPPPCLLSAGGGGGRVMFPKRCCDIQPTSPIWPSIERGWGVMFSKRCYDIQILSEPQKGRPPYNRTYNLPVNVRLQCFYLGKPPSLSVPVDSAYWSRMSPLDVENVSGSPWACWCRTNPILPLRGPSNGQEILRSWDANHLCEGSPENTLVCSKCASISEIVWAFLHSGHLLNWQPWITKQMQSTKRNAYSFEFVYENRTTSF